MHSSVYHPVDNRRWGEVGTELVSCDRGGRGFSLVSFRSQRIQGKRSTPLIVYVRPRFL